MKKHILSGFALGFLFIAIVETWLGHYPIAQVFTLLSIAACLLGREA